MDEKKVTMTDEQNQVEADNALKELSASLSAITKSAHILVQETSKRVISNLQYVGIAEYHRYMMYKVRSVSCLSWFEMYYRMKAAKCLRKYRQTEKAIISLTKIMEENEDI